MTEKIHQADLKISKVNPQLDSPESRRFESSLNLNFEVIELLTKSGKVLFGTNLAREWERLVLTDYRLQQHLMLIDEFSTGTPSEEF